MAYDCNDWIKRGIGTLVSFSLILWAVIVGLRCWLS
jgi:hypothetical protein